MKDLYTRNFNILVKEIKEDTNKWPYIPCTWTGKANVIKMSMQSLSKSQRNIL